MGARVRPLPPGTEARLRELHDARPKLGNPRIAAALGVSDTTVIVWLRAIGRASNLPANPRAVRSPDAVAEVLRLRGTGLSYAEVGRALGLTKGQVAGVLERAGATDAAPRRRARDGGAPPARPGWPKKLLCPMCREPRECRGPGDRYHVACRAAAARRDDGTEFAHSLAGRRR